MRSLIAIAVLAGCGSHYRSASPSLVSCQIDDPAAPLVVLYERDPWLRLRGSDAPTVAIWSDGSVVFRSDRARETLEGSIAAADAQRVAASVVRHVRAEPRHRDLGAVSDMRTVQVVVRDGTSWRAASVYGLERGDDDGDLGAAYRELLAVRPSHGEPFHPVDVRIVYWPFDNALGEPVPWPRELPPPPSAGAYVVEPSYLPIVERVIAEADATNPPRAIGFASGRWSVQPVRRFRGQATIDQIVACGSARGCGGSTSSRGLCRASSVAIIDR